MGVLPLAPGFDRFAIRPQPGSLEWANLSQPIRHGTIGVHMLQSPKSACLNMTITVPENTSAHVCMPENTWTRDASSAGTVLIDGQETEISTQGEGHLLCLEQDLPSGTYEIARCAHSAQSLNYAQ